MTERLTTPGYSPKIYLYKRIVQAKIFIDDHYAETIDVSNIAGEACFSQFHFMRLFKSIYGNAPHQYLIQVRIKKAALLLTSGCTVTEACYLVGFGSITSFSGLFKRVLGISPSGYLAKQQKLKQEVISNPLNFVPACFASQHGWGTK